MDLICTERLDLETFNGCEGLKDVVGSGCGVNSSLENAIDMVSVMVKQQHLYVAEHMYIDRYQEHGMEEWWRTCICRWIGEVAKEFDFEQSTVAISINYIDRFLSSQSTTKRELQLIGLVAICVASKINEMKPIQMNEMLQIAKHTFTAETIREMEIRLMATLNWHLHPPVVQNFLECFLCVIESDVQRSDAQTHFDALNGVFTSYELLEFSVLDIAVAAWALTFRGYNQQAYMAKLKCFDVVYSPHIQRIEDILFDIYTTMNPQHSIRFSPDRTHPLRAPSPVAVEDFESEPLSPCPFDSQPPTKRLRTTIV